MNDLSKNHKPVWGYLILAFVLLGLNSCGGSSPQGTNNKLAGKVSNWIGTAATLQAVFATPLNAAPPPASLAGAALPAVGGTISSTGDFELSLPTTIDDADLSPIGAPGCPGIDIAPADAKFVSSYYLEVSKGTSRLGRVYYASVLVNELPEAGVPVRGVTWVYVDKDVTITGSCDDISESQLPFAIAVSAEVDLKKGWNQVLISLNDSSESRLELGFTTAPIPGDVNWVFDSAYGLPGLEFRLALWLGLNRLR